MLLEMLQLGMNRIPAAGEVTTQQHQSMRRCAGVKNPPSVEGWFHIKRFIYGFTAIIKNIEKQEDQATKSGRMTRSFKASAAA